MSAEEEILDHSDEENENKAKKTAKHDSGAADLEKVTDYVEESEISSKELGDAIKLANDQSNKQIVAKQEKEKELSKVKISKEDVEFIIQEMEIHKSVAERVLREHNGKLTDALVALTN